MIPFVFPLQETGPAQVDAGSVEDWRGYGGDNSDTGTLLNAIAAAKTAGGMRLNVPARYYTIEQELLIDGSHISLIGQGAGRNRTTISDTQASPRTKFLWGGTAGGTMVRFNSPVGSTGCLGGGMQGIQLDGNNFAAARGLHMESWHKGDFNDVMVFACSESQFRFSVVNYLLATSVNTNVSFNRFVNCMGTTIGGGGTYLTSTAIGFHITGGSPLTNLWNACFNTFHDCNAYMSKGIGWKLEACDTNYFYNCTGNAAYDSAQYGIEFGASEQDSIRGTSHARHNMFFATATKKIHVRSTQSLDGRSSESNVVYGLSRGNSGEKPTIEDPAEGTVPGTIAYLDTYGNIAGFSLAMVENSPTPFASSRLQSILYIDEEVGPVKLKDSSGAIRQIAEIKQGDWTPVFAFTTPGDSVITYTSQVGKYWRQGHFVILMLDLEFNTNAYTTAGGWAGITGMPYAASSTAPAGSLNTTTLNNVTFTSGQMLSVAYPGGGSVIRVFINTSNAVREEAGVATFPPSKTAIRISASGVYWTTEAV